MQAHTHDGLAAARELVDRLRSAPPETTLELLRQWDEVSRHLGDVAAVASLLANVHPVEEVRTTCEQGEVEVDRLVTELRQDRALFEVFAAADPAGLDPAAARLLDKTLDDFRRAGVDLDDKTRRRLTEINERLTEVGQEFGRTIRDDVRTVRVPPERLAGLPEDWLDAHPADEDGLVTVTTDYPDSLPARMFVHDADVRRAGHGRLPAARLAGQRGAARRAVRAAPGAGDARRLRRLGVVRRRREDDQDGAGDPGVHRPDRRGRRGADAPGPRAAARALPPRRPRRRPRSTPRTRSTTRSWCARSGTTSTPSGCAPTSTSPRSSRVCST